MREAGILLHISSLPSDCGIGTLGREARDFARFLSDSGCRTWQMLPLGPTGYGDSPYQSFSSYAGNPYFISPQELAEEGLLTEHELRAALSGRCGRVDYGELYHSRIRTFSAALPRFFASPNAEYDKFCRDNSWWLDDYALFAAIKAEKPGLPWQSWEPGLKFRIPEEMERARENYREGIALSKMLQFLFSRQWERLKFVCRSLGVKIIGDIPIYVSSDSADLWSSPEYFCLDPELFPSELSGCPPDGFTETGQLWGNPIYDWDALTRDGFLWWKRRLRHAFTRFDTVRIDHFRGFDSYYSIPAGSRDARSGSWRRGPGMAFFDAISEEGEKLPLIAEDLGYLTDSVRRLLARTGFPGMKVLQFGFTQGGEEYLPHNYTKNSVAYTGTHDNPTLSEFYSGLDQRARSFAAEYFNCGESIRELTDASVRAVFSSVSELAVIPMQDLLCLGAEGRMNTPATARGNWQWRMVSPPTPALARRLKRLCRIYERGDVNV